MARSATNHEELTNFPKCDDVQQMKHTFTRFYAKHVEGHTGCIEVPLDGLMYHVPLESKLSSIRVQWTVMHRRWKFEVGR